MKRKLFIAISPPEDVKKTLSLVKKGFPEIPAKWTEKNNIHLTLLFIGHADNDKIEEIKGRIKRGVKKINPFQIEIETISYAPSGSMPPKMIWAKITRSEPLSQLRSKIRIDHDDFSPHITLARINTWQFAKMDQEELPMIEMERATFMVESVELMESKISKGILKYELLERFELNKK